MAEKTQYILCHPEPCAYQRRDAFPADTGGLSNWHEIGREFYMELERLQVSAPGVVRGIELRKLYAESNADLVRIALVSKNDAGQVYVDWLNRMVVDYIGESLYVAKTEGED